MKTKTKSLLGLLRITIACFMLRFSSAYSAAPGVLSTQGQFISNQFVTAIVTNAGTKNPARPILWAPFENSLQPSSLGLRTNWTEIQNMVWENGYAKAANGSGNW